jgi:hypothetical protein
MMINAFRRVLRSDAVLIWRDLERVAVSLPAGHPNNETITTIHPSIQHDELMTFIPCTFDI